MKDVAIVGLPSSGKSTVFEAVARTHGRGGRRTDLAVVSVPDPRVERIREIFASERAVYAQVRLVDIPGLDARALAGAREADALAVVVRAFGPDHDPVRDLRAFRAELAVTDLSTIEQALERAAKKAKGGDREAKVEVVACEKAGAVLESERWLVEGDWTPDEAQALRLLTPLTLKPVLHVANLDEVTDAGDVGVPEPRFAIRGLLEAEAAELEPDEAATLLAEYGVDETATARFVRAVYGVLGLVTFFTANEHEAHAWEVKGGTKAPQAAGVVHSDFERGFVRAEAVSFDELDAAGSWDAVREQGALRVEGKAYEVRDGDVLLIRHT